MFPICSAKLKPDFLTGSPWSPCPSLLHPAGHPHSSGWLQPWPESLPRPAWCSQAATARVQMPADPKPPLGTHKVQWPGQLPGTLSLLGLGLGWGWAELCPRGGPGKLLRACSQAQKPFTSQGSPRGGKAKGAVGRGCLGTDPCREPKVSLAKTQSLRLVRSQQGTHRLAPL